MDYRIRHSVAALSLVVLSFGVMSSASAAPEQAYAGPDLITGVVIGTPLPFVVDHDDVLMTIAHGFGTNSPKCVVVTPPTHGTLTYQPDPDLCDFYYTANATFTGTDTFLYSISFNGSLPAQALVTLQSTPAVTTTTTTVAPTTTTTAVATTTTTALATTTTMVAPTTTTTIAVVSATTAAPGSTATTSAANNTVLTTTARAAAATTTVAAVVLSARALPTTGTDAATMSLLAALLLLCGFGFVWHNHSRKVAMHRRKMMRR